MKNDPTKVILHCSATPDEGNRFGIEQIKQWHMVDNGWSDVGYHYVIRRDGVVEVGRPEDIMGAHCVAGGGNHDSLGICWVGTKYPTLMQIESIVGLYHAIKFRHGIKYSHWYGHYEFDGRKPDCPGFSMVLFREFMKYAYGVS